MMAQVVARIKRATVRVFPAVESERAKGLGFMLPALVVYVAFLAIPALALFGLSFFSWNGLSNLTFVGLANYADVFTDDVFYTALQNNVVVAVLGLVLQCAGGLAIALGIKHTYDWLRPYFQMAVLLPMTLMAVAVAFLWSYMYNPAYGVLNTLLGSLGVKSAPAWLGDPRFALFAIVIVATWQWTGFRTLLWLTGMDDIDERLYEAAKMDGASSFQQFRYVTLPLLKPITIFIVIFTIIGSFRSFAYFWVMTSGGPGHATEVMVTWIYKTAFTQSNFGRASALSVVLFVITLVLSALALRWGGEGGGGGVAR